MKEEKFPIHSRLHYSTSSYVSYYLVRENPFINSLIKLQNYCMENPNRTFDSIFNTQKILENTTDCRELIPEFFCTMEFMINFNCCFYGIKTDKSIVDDVISQIHTKTNNNIDTKKKSDTDRGTSKDTESAIQSKNAFADYIKTLIFNRRIINNSQVAKGIINWINYIFGVNQLTKKAESCNTFEKYSYTQNINLEDKNVLKNLSKLLGATDLEGQLSQIEMTSNFLDEQIKKAEKEREKNESMYRKLGMIIGLGIVIILI